MRKMMRWGMTACLLYGAAVAGFAQRPPMRRFPGNRTEDLEKMKDDNPELYKFEKRLSDIRQEAQAILTQYADSTLTKAQAKEKLTPLLKEERDIHNDPEYMAEKRLDMALNQRHMAPGMTQLPLPPKQKQRP